LEHQHHGHIKRTFKKFVSLASIVGPYVHIVRGLYSTQCFYARHTMCSARVSYRNSVCLSVCLPACQDLVPIQAQMR